MGKRTDAKRTDAKGKPRRSLQNQGAQANILGGPFVQHGPG